MLSSMFTPVSGSKPNDAYNEIKDSKEQSDVKNAKPQILYPAGLDTPRHDYDFTPGSWNNLSLNEKRKHFKQALEDHKYVYAAGALFDLANNDNNPETAIASFFEDGSCVEDLPYTCLQWFSALLRETSRLEPLATIMNRNFRIQFYKVNSSLIPPMYRDDSITLGFQENMKTQGEVVTNALSSIVYSAASYISSSFLGFFSYSVLPPPGVVQQMLTQEPAEANKGEEGDIELDVFTEDRGKGTYGSFGTTSVMNGKK